MTVGENTEIKRWYAKYHTLLADMAEIERITWREVSSEAPVSDLKRALVDIRRIAKAPLEHEAKS